MFSINVVSTIALNTFRETVRDRVLYAILLFALIATGAGALLGSLSVQQDVRILLDLGLFTITIFGGVIALFIGTNLVFKEIDRKTILLIFTKPISKAEFVTGKFLGLSLCIFVVTFAMGFFLYAITSLQVARFGPILPLLGALSLVYLELLLVIAMATCFSTFATPLMSMLFTLGLWVCGHLSNSLWRLSEMSTNALTKYVSQGIYYVMPDLASLTMIRSDMIDAIYPQPITVLVIIAYVFVYSFLLLSLASVIAARREFQ